MVSLETMPNGHCAAAAISWIYDKTPGLAKAFVGLLLELYDDPKFAEILQLGLATCRAQNADLQHITETEFHAGLRTGEIWSDHPELTMLGKALNLTIIVWQMDEELKIATPTCGFESDGGCSSSCGGNTMRRWSHGQRWRST